MVPFWSINSTDERFRQFFIMNQSTEQHWVKESHVITVLAKPDRYNDGKNNSCFSLPLHIALKVKFKDSTSSWVTMVWQTLSLGKSRFNAEYCAFRALITSHSTSRYGHYPNQSINIYISINIHGPKENLFILVNPNFKLKKKWRCSSLWRNQNITSRVAKKNGKWYKKGTILDILVRYRQSFLLSFPLGHW